jgi:hypothetical protein
MSVQKRQRERKKAEAAELKRMTRKNDDRPAGGQVAERSDLDGADIRAKHVTREPRVVGAAVAECVGERENPLPHRRFRKNAIDQMCRRIGHATCENATAKERAQLLFDEARRRLLPRGRAREEVFQLLADDLVKEGQLRLVAPILGHGAPFRDRRGAAPRDRSGVKPPASEGGADLADGDPM